MSISPLFLKDMFADSLQLFFFLGFKDMAPLSSHLCISPQWEIHHRVSLYLLFWLLLIFVFTPCFENFYFDETWYSFLVLGILWLCVCVCVYSFHPMLEIFQLLFIQIFSALPPLSRLLWGLQWMYVRPLNIVPYSVQFFILSFHFYCCLQVH